MHTHYKGTGKVHSFRGLLVDGGQNQISIEGSVGAIAWRITQFKIFPQIMDTSRDSLVKIFREEQSSVNGETDFRNDELLAAALWTVSDRSGGPYSDDGVIFDNQLFVRNIFVTHVDNIAATTMNYYIELEEVKVSATGMAQLAIAAARRTGDTS